MAPGNGPPRPGPPHGGNGPPMPGCPCQPGGGPPHCGPPRPAAGGCHAGGCCDQRGSTSCEQTEMSDVAASVLSRATGQAPLPPVQRHRRRARPPVQHARVRFRYGESAQSRVTNRRRERHDRLLPVQRPSLNAVLRTYHISPAPSVSQRRVTRLASNRSFRGGELDECVALVAGVS